MFALITHLCIKIKHQRSHVIPSSLSFFLFFFILLMSSFTYSLLLLLTLLCLLSPFSVVSLYHYSSPFLSLLLCPTLPFLTCSFEIFSSHPPGLYSSEFGVFNSKHHFILEWINQRGLEKEERKHWGFPSATFLQVSGTSTKNFTYPTKDYQSSALLSGKRSRWGWGDQQLGVPPWGCGSEEYDCNETPIGHPLWEPDLSVEIPCTFSFLNTFKS